MTLVQQTKMCHFFIDGSEKDSSCLLSMANPCKSIFIVDKNSELGSLINELIALLLVESCSPGTVHAKEESNH